MAAYKRRRILTKKRLSAFLLCLCLCLAAAVPGAFSAEAESGTTVGDFIVTGGKNGTDYPFEKGDAGKSQHGKLTILTSTKLTVSNVHALTAVTDHIVIKKDAAAPGRFFVRKKKKGL